MAARTSLRNVFEHVTIADLAAGQIPTDVARLAAEYSADTRHS